MTYLINNCLFLPWWLGYVVDGPYQEAFGVYRKREEIPLRIEYQF